MKRLTLLTASLAVMAMGHAQAGEDDGGLPPLKRQLDTIADNVGGETIFLPSAGEDRLAFDVVGIFWDERCAGNVEYTFNTAFGANEGTAEEIPASALIPVVQKGLDEWNNIPTSFIKMDIVNEVDLVAIRAAAGDPFPEPVRGFDFVNEVSFFTPATFTALASSPSFSLTSDATFEPGDDLDGDGDSDVYDPEVEGINVCTDVDGDEDFEFPAGFYKRGTILDNDVQFSSNLPFPWELEPTSFPTASDVDGVSIHEFGHSHGLSHSFNNQISDEDGTGATMFPFIDITDAESEFAQRDLSMDDIAASSHLYPEGSGDAAGALQPGDVAFDTAFDLLEGSVFDPAIGLPSTGAALQAIDRRSGEVLAQAYSGAAILAADPTGACCFIADLDPAVNNQNGDFYVPVPKNSFVQLRMESMDGDPAAGGNISLTALLGDFNGTNVFREDHYNQRSETGSELDPDEASSFFSFQSRAKDLDMIVDPNLFLRNAGVFAPGGGSADTSVNPFLDDADTAIFAEQFDGGFVSFLIDIDFEVIGGTFHTFALDASQNPIFASAQLVLGKLDDDGNVDIVRVLNRQRNFVGQDGDDTPLVVPNPNGVGRRIQSAIARDPDLDVFLLLETPTLVDGVSGAPASLIGVEQDDAPAGTSFLSLNGGPLEPFTEGTFAINLDFTDVFEF